MHQQFQPVIDGGKIDTVDIRAYCQISSAILYNINQHGIESVLFLTSVHPVLLRVFVLWLPRGKVQTDAHFFDHVHVYRGRVDARLRAFVLFIEVQPPPPLFPTAYVNDTGTMTTSNILVSTQISSLFPSTHAISLVIQTKRTDIPPPSSVRLRACNLL